LRLEMNQLEQPVSESTAGIAIKANAVHRREKFRGEELRPVENRLGRPAINAHLPV